MPKAYVTECDSLGNIVLVQDAQITGLREEVVKTDDLMTYELDLKQQEINRRKNVTDSLIGIAVGLQHSNDNLLRMAKPTRKLYLSGSGGLDATRRSGRCGIHLCRQKEYDDNGAGGCGRMGMVCK